MKIKYSSTKLQSFSNRLYRAISSLALFTYITFKLGKLVILRYSFSSVDRISPNGDNNNNNNNNNNNKLKFSIALFSDVIKSVLQKFHIKLNTIP